ncbi:MAG: DNA topoisomerase IV subunit A [Erysipelotrichales bacterium]|nr:DNA topoisomerase IV subunit A [Erysipelotrichales bacterium]
MNDTQEALSKIHNYALEEIMGQCFGRYSKYIIQDRAIPDVRDGLKPVQRRIIYAMYIDHNTSDKAFKKCANAVGNVLGKFHPHGDTSVYDALVRMSQDWKQSHILVEVDGNNGSIDGDPAAAMRYTETRLAKISDELLKDIEKNTIPMVLNYSDTILEPTVLPAKFPNLLVNGSTGISAGYATNIPPHNLGEIIDATIKRIDSPNCRLDTILDIVKGPDFPTGGIIEGLDGIRQAFETGKGKVVVSCKYTFEKTKGKEQIIISEIPYEVNKQQLVKKIDDIRLENKIAGIAEVRDESDKDASVRIVIDLKAGADKNLVMNYLLKNTDCQCNYNYNMVAIVNRRPKLLGIISLIDAYIVHIKEVIKKRSEYDLAVAKKEVHLTEGLVKAISILDEVIAVIRASSNKKDAKENLIAKFEFTPEQAEVILTLQLYKLTNTDILELEKKLENLRKIIAGLEAILADETKLAAVVKDELKRIKKEYAIPRKTEISEIVKDISISAEDLIIKENVMIVLTSEGYIKKVPMKSYSSANGEETAVKPGDYPISIYETNTLNKIVIFTKLGNYIFIPVNDIPWSKWKDLGKHVSNLVTIHPEDSVVASFIVNESTQSDTIVMFTKQGMVKRCRLEDFIVSRYTKLYTSMKLKDGDEVVNIAREKENTMIVTKTGYYISYKTNEIPYSSSKSSGVKGINLKDDEVSSGLTYGLEDEYLNIFTNQKTAKRVKLTDLTQLSRAKRGSMVLKKVKTTNYEVVSSIITNTKDTIGLAMLEDIGILKNTDIPIMDLASTGSAIAKKKYNYAFKFTEIEKIEEVAAKPKKQKKNEEEAKQEEMEFIEDFKL